MTARELNRFPEVPGTQEFPRIATFLRTTIFLLKVDHLAQAYTRIIFK